MNPVPEQLRHEVHYETSDRHTAHAIGNIGVHVLSTVSLIEFIEGCAGWSVVPFLEEGEVTVGTLVNIRHVAPAPAGTTVRVESRLTMQDGRKLLFDATAYDGERVLMTGQHGRMVIRPSEIIHNP